MISIIRRIGAPILTVIILVALYSQLELSRIGEELLSLDWVWIAASIILFLPIFWIRAWRFNMLMDHQLGLSNALKVIFASSSLNLILPSKGGEIAKIFFIREHVVKDISSTTALVVYERVLDVAGLVFFFAIGLIWIDDQRPLYVATSLGAIGLGAIVLAYFAVHLMPRVRQWITRWPDRVARFRDGIGQSRDAVSGAVRGQFSVQIFFSTILLWAVHLAQFFCFFAAVKFIGPVSAIVAYVPAAIVVGLLPLTVAGIGTRDAALILLFAPWSAEEPLALIGMLAVLRIVLPGMCGIWFTHDYVRGKA